MIKLIAKLIVKEDKIDELKKILPELVSETRKEAGCIVYEFYQDNNDKRLHFFDEEWENQDVLNKHMATKHFIDAQPKFAAIMEKEMEVSICTLVI